MNTETNEPVKLLAAEWSIHERRAKLLSELDESEINYAIDLVEEQSTTAEASWRSGRLRGELTNLIAAENLIRDKRASAIKAHHAAEAAGKRAEARAKREKAAAINAMVEKHLLKLTEIEGVTFDRSIVNAQRIGSWMASLATSVHATPDRNPLEVSPDIGPNGGRYAEPMSRRLMSEAGALETEAGRLERQDVRRSGACEGPSFDALVKELAARPLEIAPRLQEIADWLNATDQRLYTKVPDGFPQHPRTYRIAWTGSKLDPPQCSLWVNHIEIGSDWGGTDLRMRDLTPERNDGSKPGPTRPSGWRRIESPAEMQRVAG